MNNLILTHPINPIRENVEKRLVSYWDWLIKDIPILQKNARKLSVSAIFDANFRGISYCEWLKKDKSITYQFLFYANQLGIANYKMACEWPGTEQEIEVQFGNKTVKTMQKFTHNYVGTITWVMCIYTAIILRDKIAIAFLKTISTLFMEHDYTKADSFDVQYTNFIKSLFKDIEKREGAWAECIYQIENEGYVALSRKEYVKHLHHPELLVYEAIFKEDNELLNERLVHALQMHRQFYSDPEREGDPWGWISYALISACSIAYDKGMSIEVESDYLPKWMIENDFKDIALIVS